MTLECPKGFSFPPVDEKVNTFISFVTKKQNETLSLAVLPKLFIFIVTLRNKTTTFFKSYTKLLNSSLGVITENISFFGTFNFFCTF